MRQISHKNFTENFVNRILWAFGHGMFTANLWCQKQLLCQLKHNHCPKVIKYFENDNFSYKSIKIIGQIDGPL